MRIGWIGREAGAVVGGQDANAGAFGLVREDAVLLSAPATGRDALRHEEDAEVVAGDR